MNGPANIVLRVNRHGRLSYTGPNIRAFAELDTENWSVPRELGLCFVLVSPMN